LGGANDSGAWGSSAAHAEHDADPAHDENGTLDLPLAPGTEAESSSVDGGASNGTNGQVRRESDDIDLTLDLGSRGPDASSEKPSMQATDTSDLTSGPSSDDDASASDITSNGASSVDTGSSSDDESAVTTETTSDHQTSVGTELTSEDQSSSADTSSADTSSAYSSTPGTPGAGARRADASPAADGPAGASTCRAVCASSERGDRP